MGTTVTAWILSLTGLDSGNFFVQLLKPTSFTPVLALVGVILTMAGGSNKKKDAGMILLGFAVLMFGMDTMSGAVSGLKDVPAFQNLLLLFTNPVLGVLAGAALTAIIQSSSASVGILQALSATGQVTYGAAIPIIMGQNIGTCVTAMISSVGANKNAKRAATVHLLFNLVGTGVWLMVFYGVHAVVQFSFVTSSIDQLGIAVVHTAFEPAVHHAPLPLFGAAGEDGVPSGARCQSPGENSDPWTSGCWPRPLWPLGRCQEVAETMARVSMDALKASCQLLVTYDPKTAQAVRESEGEADQYEDMLGTYLVKLGQANLSAADSRMTAKLLHLIGDFERISDHAVNLVESAEEITHKGPALFGSGSAGAGPFSPPLWERLWIWLWRPSSKTTSPWRPRWNRWNRW